MSKNNLNKRIKRGTHVASSFLPYNEGDLYLSRNQAGLSVSPNLFRLFASAHFSYWLVVILCVSFFLQGVNYVSASTDFETVELVTVATNNPNYLVAEVEVTESEIDSVEDFDEAMEVNYLPDDSQSDDDTNLDQISLDTDTSESPRFAIESVTSSTTMTNATTDLAPDVDELDSVDQAEGEDIATGTSESISVVQSDTAYTFNRRECTTLASGSFYCLKQMTDILKDSLFAAPDKDGDLEIFLVRDGKQRQVTDNLVDDAAPYFDPNSNTIVWHRLINERFQIVSYDIESGKEEILTSTNQNNMEPTRQGEYTVWQRWLDGYWHIFLYDGSKEVKLSKSGGHNLAPHVHGSLVVWNKQSLDGQKAIEMYDIETRSYVSVPDAEGLSVTNPRMVFVFDSLTPEGDIITKGYDVMSREFIDLDTLPKSIPEQIPNSDSTGETRALIQSKPTLKTELEEIEENEGLIVNPDPEPDQLTLDLRTSIVASTSEQIDQAIPDLVIEVYDSIILSSSSEQTTD